jgi:hypothetical protein
MGTLSARRLCTYRGAGEDMAVMESHLRSCQVCGRMAILFRVSILLTPDFASCHGPRSGFSPGGEERAGACGTARSVRRS